MIRWGIECWADLPPWLRYGIAGIFLLISTVLWFCGRFWPWGWAVGIVLLLFAGTSGPALLRVLASCPSLGLSAGQIGGRGHWQFRPVLRYLPLKGMCPAWPICRAR